MQAQRDLQKHYKIILEQLSSQMKAQVERVSTSLKTHQENVKARTERISSKYGYGNEQIKTGVIGLNGGATNYAMFAHNNIAQQQTAPSRLSSSGKSAVATSQGSDPLDSNLGNVRKRNLETQPGRHQHISPYADNSSSSAGAASSGRFNSTGGGLVQELMQQKESTGRADYRLQNAKAVEASVAQASQPRVSSSDYVLNCCYENKEELALFCKIVMVFVVCAVRTIVRANDESRDGSVRGHISYRR